MKLLIIPALTIVAACTAPGQTCQPNPVGPIIYTKSGSPVYADPEPTLGGCHKPSVAVIHARDGSDGAHGSPVASDDKTGDHHSRPDPSPSDPTPDPAPSRAGGDNGWGNGDQSAPGKSGPHNNAENDHGARSQRNHGRAKP